MTKIAPPPLAALYRKLGYEFADSTLVEQALAHTSYANERKSDRLLTNERLEFLGDAVLGLIVSTHLYRSHDYLPEGELTKARASIVCEPTLARRAKALGIGEYLRLGRGEAASGGRERDSILADAFEAIIGAIYIDGGFTAACAFVLNQLVDDLDQVAGGNYGRDFKTLLQEIAQRGGEGKIVYEVVGESGPDHNKTFTVEVSVNSVRLGSGTGRSKKEAEQHAASQAVNRLNENN